MMRPRLDLRVLRDLKESWPYLLSLEAPRLSPVQLLWSLISNFLLRLSCVLTLILVRSGPTWIHWRNRQSQPLPHPPRFLLEAFSQACRPLATLGARAPPGCFPAVISPRRPPMSPMSPLQQRPRHETEPEVPPTRLCQWDAHSMVHQQPHWEAGGATRSRAGTRPKGHGKDGPRRKVPRGRSRNDPSQSLTRSESCRPSWKWLSVEATAGNLLSDLERNQCPRCSP
mmetsp:Transcript_39675/g.81155  ORF Transcript_39675/g.81155 Transcript_39675/m.81155 type:complete len:227 (-) Transcript_39675:520-1200(-)